MPARKATIMTNTMDIAFICTSNTFYTPSGNENLRKNYVKKLRCSFYMLTKLGASLLDDRVHILSGVSRNLTNIKLDAEFLELVKGLNVFFAE